MNTKDDGVALVRLREFSDLVRRLVDYPGYATPTMIAAHLGVSVSRVRQMVAELQLIPAATVAIYDAAQVKQIHSRLFGREEALA